MRKVVLKLTTQKDLIEHQSNANTFGELKKEMRQVKWSGMRVVERSTKTTLQMDDAVLPQGEFILFLVPEKVKSGKKTSGGTEELSKNIEECNYNECRSHMSWLNRNKDANLDMSGGTASLQMELTKYYKKNPGNTSAAPKAEAKKPKAEKAEKAEKLPVWKETPREDDEDDEDYADRLAFEKKAFDKKAKKVAEKEEAARIAKEKLRKEKEEKEAAEKKAAEKAPSKENSDKVKKAKKKGIFGLGGKKEDREAPAPTDPIEIIEASREKINKAVDQIVLDMIENGGTVPAVLQYTADDLEKEIKKIHSALRTSRSSAKYID